jgi:hypothetical protein
MFYSNYYIDNYLLWILLVINILILILVILKYYSENKLMNNINILLLTCLNIYILLNRKHLIFNKGKLVNPSKNLLYIHIIILCIFYLLTNNKVFSNKAKLIYIILILTPLLFPLEDYFIYRVILLQILFSISCKYKLWEKLN